MTSQNFSEDKEASKGSPLEVIAASHRGPKREGICLRGPLARGPLAAEVRKLELRGFRGAL